MDIQLKMTLVNGANSSEIRSKLEAMINEFRDQTTLEHVNWNNFKNLQDRHNQYFIFSCLPDDSLESLIESTGLESYALFDGEKLCVYDNGRVFICSNLEFVVRKHFEVQQYQQELESVSHLLNEEILRLKHFYRRKVPARSQEVSGIKITSRFKTGSLPGGDFFDIIETKNTIQFLMCSVDSYLLNSQIIDEVLNYKQAPQQNIQSFCMSMVELQKTFQSSPIDLLVFEIQKDTRQIQGYQFGSTDLFLPLQESVVHSNKLTLQENDLELAYFTGVLEQGASLVVSSSGVIKNWEEIEDLKTFYDLLRSTNSSQEILESVIIRLYEQNCIKYDVSMIWIEVNKYDIRKV